MLVIVRGGRDGGRALAFDHPPVDTAPVSGGGLVIVRQAPRDRTDAAPRAGTLPADGLLHPAALLALGLLVLNDHVLKAAYPGAITGKLSDLAGLAFFPILLVGAWELARAVAGRWQGPSTNALAIAIGGSAAAFMLVKTWPAAAQAFAWGLGLAQWLLGLPVRLLDGGPLPPVIPTLVVVDPTDLIATVALAVPAWIGVQRVRAARP